MYSQHDEERIILENTPAFGNLLDVGAYDGKSFSNSLALIEKGWHATCIEAASEPFVKLEDLHRTNEKVTLVHALVGNLSGYTPFYDSPHAIATTELAHMEKWQKRYPFRKIFMPRIPLTVITSGASYDFVSIDTEGTSVDILFEMYLDELKTNLVCVEFDNRRSEVIEHFRAMGFSVIYESAENIIARRNK